MRISHRQRPKHDDIAGDARFLTFSCLRRLPLPNRDHNCDWMIDAIDLGRKRAPFDLWAFVVMPEHVHLVIVAKNGARVSGVITTMKQPVSKRALH